QRGVPRKTSRKRRGTGRQVVRKGAPARVPRMQQHCEVSHLLRNRMRDDRQRGCGPEREIGDESRGDDDAVAEIMDAVANQDHQPRSSAVETVTMASLRLA